MSVDTAFEIGMLRVQLKRIADVITGPTHDIFIGLPGLLGYWPMSIRDGTGQAVDHAGVQGPAGMVGTVPVGYDGNSYSHLGSGTNYFNAGAGGGVVGNETWINSSIRGLTVGGWFMVDSAPAVNCGLFSREGAAANYGWALIWQPSGLGRFGISQNGAAVYGVSSPAVPISQWHFVAGRFIPSTEVAVFVDADKTVNDVNIPATINVSTQAMEIGRYRADNTRITHAKARDVFICATALSDALIEEVRTTSAP